MRDLSLTEVRDVSGGNPIVLGAVAGAVTTGYGAWHGGGNAGQIASAAILGGVSGFYGGLGMFGSSIAVAVLATFSGGGGRIVNYLR